MKKALRSHRLAGQSQVMRVRVPVRIASPQMPARQTTSPIVTRPALQVDPLVSTSYRAKSRDTLYKVMRTACRHYARVRSVKWLSLEYPGGSPVCLAEWQRATIPGSLRRKALSPPSCSRAAGGHQRNAHAEDSDRCDQWVTILQGCRRLRGEIVFAE